MIVTLLLRPKKTAAAMASVFRVPRDEDPCLNSASVDSILPLIPDRNPSGGGGSGSGGGPPPPSTSSSVAASSSGNAAGTQVIKIMSISNGQGRSVELPSLNVEHNYPQLLSELVMRL